MPRVLGLKKEADEPTQFEQYDESPEQDAEDIEIDLTERPPTTKFFTTTTTEPPTQPWVLEFYLIPNDTILDFTRKVES